MVSNNDLPEILRLHKLWLDGKKGGVRADLSGKTVMRRAFLPSADLRKANLRNSIIRGAFMPNANLEGADLTGADLTGARGTGVRFKSALLCETKLVSVDMSCSNFEGALLDSADLTNANLNRARMSNASMLLTNFTGARLCYAGLSGACMDGAVLRMADLRNCNLEGVDLRRANLRGAPCFSQSRGTPVYQATVMTREGSSVITLVAEEDEDEWMFFSDLANGSIEEITNHLDVIGNDHLTLKYQNAAGYLLHAARLNNN